MSAEPRCLSPLPVALSPRERARLFVRAHAWNATSAQVLGPGYRYWFDDDGRGCVAYQDTGSAWVVAGAPICAAAHRSVLVEAFAAAAADAGRRVVFFGAEQDLARQRGLQALLVGEQPVWNPQRWPETVRGSRSLREQHRRARAKGVRVRRLAPAEALGAMRPRLEALVQRWLESRPMTAMGFVVRPGIDSASRDRRFYVAERGGAVCAALVCLPVPARNGWLFEHLLRDPDAVNGTTDLLVDLAMRDLAQDGATYATLGLAPLSGDVNRWLRLARRLGTPLYRFEGVWRFKARLRPHRWDPIYVVAPARRAATLLGVLDSLRAFAGGSLWRFGLRTLRRDPGLPLRALVRPGLSRLAARLAVLTAMLGSLSGE